MQTPATEAAAGGMPGGYAELRRTVAWGEAGPRGTLVAAGPDAVRFIDSFTTAAVAPLAVGAGTEGFFTDARGWVLALVPLSGIASAMLVGRVVNPVLRRWGARWSPQRAALVSLATFLAAVAGAVLLAVAGGMFLEALRLDARGGILGSYVQRNALVVAFGMSFAIIPLVFTIADDALSSVPEHLRSASLGAGATLWQTAVRV
ncbi:MAG: hypothetical protein EBX36_04545, partial [Planctomycetia bacterium]|nr:hypothetical protein [Planctomycetia bacterium]